MVWNKIDTMTKRKVKEPIRHPQITEVILMGDRELFPISWLHKQEFCEYQIFLEYMKGIEVEPTNAMIEGKQEHERLELEFEEKAVPANFAEMVKQSKTTKVVSREFRVKSFKYGVYGSIDEIWLMPDEFVVIDDKPGTKAYLSNVHQVYGYCLAFKEMVKHQDRRQIVAALRERGTDNIYWKAPFDERAENEVISVINHIHGLILGNDQFNSNRNPNKCRKCRFKESCDRVISLESN